MLEGRGNLRASALRAWGKDNKQRNIESTSHACYTQILWETQSEGAGVSIVKVEGSPGKITFKQRWEGRKRREGQREGGGKEGGRDEEERKGVSHADTGKKLMRLGCKDECGDGSLKNNPQEIAMS